MKLPKILQKLSERAAPAADIRQNRQRSLKNGGYAAVLAVVLVTVLVLLNLVVRALPTRYTQYDISIGSMFTLTDTTRSLMAELDRDVTAYYLGITGQEDANITRILDRYADLSPHFTWQQRDPNLYPTLAQQYGAAAASIDSVILVCEGRSRLVDYNELYLIDTTYYYINGDYSVSFDAENALTAGIAGVLRTTAWPLYQLTGHGELTLTADFTQTLESIGVAVQELNMVNADSVPQDAAVLLISAPQVDYTGENINVLRSWLQAGGRLLVFTDFTVDTPNLDGLLQEYGLARQPGVLIETDPNYYAYGNPQTYLLPEVQVTEMTAGMAAGMYVFAPLAQGILTSFDYDYVYDPLLSTTQDSFSLVDYLNAELVQQGPDDPSGPFDIAVALWDDYNDVKLIWVNCPNVLDSSADSAVYGGNAQFVGSLVNWLNDQEPTAVIDAKSMSGVLLNVPLGAAVWLGLAFVLVLPVGGLIFGAVYCLLRRRK